MKKLIAVICCFGFLLFAGTFESKANERIYKQFQYENIDVGKISTINKLIAFDLLQFRQESRGTIVSINLNLDKELKKIPNDAFAPRYNLVPECRRVYITVRQFRYSTHYTFQFSNLYNPPPGG